MNYPRFGLFQLRIEVGKSSRIEPPSEKVHPYEYRNRHVIGVIRSPHLESDASGPVARIFEHERKGSLLSCQLTLSTTILNGMRNLSSHSTKNGRQKKPKKNFSRGPKRVERMHSTQYGKGTDEEEYFQLVERMRKSMSDFGYDICNPFRVTSPPLGVQLTLRLRPPSKSPQKTLPSKFFFMFFVHFFFQVSSYNNLVNAKHRFELKDGEDCVGFLIGNTKTIWQKFVQFVVENGMMKDPVESFCKEAVNRVLSDLNRPDYGVEVRYDSDSPASGKFVHIQTAGHVSGDFSVVFFFTRAFFF